MIRGLIALLVLLAAAAAQETPPLPPTQPVAPQPAESSPWYLERGTQVRAPGPLDPVPETVGLLTALLRDGHIPGFYDGQFSTLAGHFDQLAAISSDPDMNHVLRVMAIMALQEVGSGEPVAEVLRPMLLAPQNELDFGRMAWQIAGRDDSPEFIATLRASDLSEHARFALAKDGQPAAVLAKIREMERRISRRADILDPSIDSDDPRSTEVAWGRQVAFDIGYHYQQFDDFTHASEWFHKLTDALPGHRDTKWPHYNLACIAALEGRPEEALKHLEEAWKVGFSDVAWMLEDGDLKSVRDKPEFQALANRIRGLQP